MPDRQTPATPEPMALWGGLECSVVRVGDLYHDQFRDTGHWERIEDLDLVAGLGIRTLRYPILWEHVSPGDPDQCDWTWHDVRLARLRELGIEPIVGLVHHGSGPRYTSLSDPNFPEGLARHAQRVAERYPWVTKFNPVNEPLTTARFSGLYGHWYPHERGEHPFLRILFNECRAIALSMAAIRQVTPGAQLIQTEDLGKVFSTPKLRYQAEYENERRWLSFDLLCGRVHAGHRFFKPLLHAGIAERQIAELRGAPALPDVLGINHYLTSDRYLDFAWWKYPDECRGGNGRDRYADVEAARILHLEDELGVAARLREAWERYGLPIAVTEAHLGCTPDEQMRWLLDVWKDACTVRAEGVDIRAVTIWSMFGAVDWVSLLTSRTGFYEPGAFDIRHSPPQPTILARAAAQLCAAGTCDEADAVPIGWWRRPDRAYQLPARSRVG